MPTDITTPLHQPALAQKIRNFGSALRGLMNATYQQSQALRTNLLHRHNNPQPMLTSLEEANQLRAMADGIYASDPRFAQDLYAAATRHELAGSTC